MLLRYTGGLLIALVLYCMPVRAQRIAIDHKFPFRELGLPAPEAGKVVIVDFFSSFCQACFQALPKLKDLQDKLSDSLQLMLVGVEDGKVRRTYERFEKAYGLRFPIAYDSSLVKRALASYPTYAWVDAVGTLRAMTGGTEMTEENVRAFVDGKTPVLGGRVRFDHARFYEPASGGEVLLRSRFAKWEDGEPRSVPSSFDDDKTGLFQPVGVPLEWLYLYAYAGTNYMNYQHPLYGTLYPKVIWEDGIVPAPDLSMRYSYSLQVAPGTVDSLAMWQLRADLERLLPYRVRLALRPMPVYAITLPGGDTSLYKTKFKKPRHQLTHSRLEIEGMPFHTVMGHITKYYRSGPVFINETGIVGPVDLILEGVFGDIVDLRKALRQAGLDLVEKRRPMQVILLSAK